MCIARISIGGGPYHGVSEFAGFDCYNFIRVEKILDFILYSFIIMLNSCV